MNQDEVKLDIVKRFTNSLEMRDGKLVTTLDEDNYYEFKKSLSATANGISKNYLKTIAGLANNKGGIIIFGIEPDNQELVGIKERFANFDNKLVNTIVSEFLDGLSSFYFFTHRHETTLLGFLLINEPTFKPVIVKSNFQSDGESHSSGDIYFRYPGEVLKIKPSDLRELMSREINRHAQNLIQQINTLVNIGPENAAIINSKTGEINANNAKLILSPEILGDLNLIMEGQFVDKEGAPAYVIKGNIEMESGGPVSKVIKVKEQSALHNRDYHLSLLENSCSNPKNFLKDIVYRDTYYLPVFYFARKSNLSNSEAKSLLESQNSPDLKKLTKSNIIKRLTSPEYCNKLNNQGTIKHEIVELEINKECSAEQLKSKYGLKGNAEKTIIRSVIFNKLNTVQVVEIEVKKKFLKEFIESFTHLDAQKVVDNQQFYCSELKSVLNDHTQELSADSSAKTTFRKTICLIDYYLFSAD